MTKQVHLAAHFPGVNNTTVWSDPKSGSHIEFSSFAQLAQTAERAKFDFLFLAEGLRLREQNGQIYDLDVVGRPDTFTVLAALAAVTDRLGLAGTINSTFNEPYEVARQFASLDHLSGGRAAWNVVTSWDAFTGENFRRGGYLPQDARYERARTFMETTWELFDSWRGGEIIADKESGLFLPAPTPGDSSTGTPTSTSAASSTCPAARRGAGHLPGGRLGRGPRVRGVERRRDLQPARHAGRGRPFYADVKGRLAKYGRTPDQLLILPAATFVLGDTDADAAELARVVRRQQVSGQTAIAFLEQLWNRDLSGYDPDGPLPDVDPELGEHTIARGRASVRMYRDPMATAAQWRAKAEAEKLSIRDLIIEVTGRQTFIGSPSTVAGAINELVQADASDGFILVPHITPGGLDEFADTVVPLLQERGVFRTEYEGSTLREHLGLAPVAMTATPLAVLDLVPISSGSTAAQALCNSIDLAQAAERFGYARYWFAEHHLNPGVAGTSLAVLLALTAGATSTIRIGSGAVQMGHRTALSTVEEFGLIDALYPGRVDLGLGSPQADPGGVPRGFGGGGGAPPESGGVLGGRPPRASRANNGLLIPPRFSAEHLLSSPRFALQKTLLQLPGAPSQDYTEQVGDILALLRGTYKSAEGGRGAGRPGGGREEAVDPRQQRRGEPLVAGPTASGSQPTITSARRPSSRRPKGTGRRSGHLMSWAGLTSAFRPTSWSPRLGQARELAAGYGRGCAAYAARRAQSSSPRQRGPPASGGLKKTWRWSRAPCGDAVCRDSQPGGGPTGKAAGSDTKADEVMVTTITHQHADRVRSYELLAEEWQRR